MSEFHVTVVRIGEITKHPNADSLSCTLVLGGYPVSFRTADFSEGDLAVYVPVDSVVPNDDKRWQYLVDEKSPTRQIRIKAKRLRGIFSMGLLTANDGWSEGDDVASTLRITRYDPPESFSTGGENEKDPGFLPVYTDIEGLRRYKTVLVQGEQVVLTEKIHGANGRYLWRDDRLWCGSHTCIKREDDKNMWWAVAKKLDLASKLSCHQNIAVYGEVYGQVQDLKYGLSGTADLILFDALDTVTRKYLDYDEFLALAKDLDLKTVPELYRGPWDDSLISHSEGQTVAGDGLHVREGFVVRPTTERYDLTVGRVVLKMVGEGYHMRKQK